jgi:hypothetical protein
MNTHPPHSSSYERVVHYKFGPNVIAIAKFLVPLITCTDTVSLFQEVDRRWPDLSFRDFLGAAVLAEALALEPRGRA